MFDFDEDFNFEKASNDEEVVWAITFSDCTVPGSEEEEVMMNDPGWRISDCRGSVTEWKFGREKDVMLAINALNRAGINTWRQMQTNEADRVMTEALQW